MTLEATLDATVGDSAVEFAFRAENAGEEPVELTFTSGKTADVAVYSVMKEVNAEPVWRWSDHRMFTQAIRERTLGPGETIAQAFSWENPPAGEYVARGTLAADEPAEAETTLTV